MTIRAKMNCFSVLKTSGQEVVKLTAVTANSEENKTYSKFTPSASVEMTITNPDALGFFEAGKEYTIDFNPAAA